MKTLIWIIILAVVVAGIWWFLSGRKTEEISGAPNGPAESQPVPEDDSGPTVEVEGSGSVTVTLTKIFNVTGRKFSFDPAELRVKKGDLVRIVFKNEDGMHNWRLDEFNAATKILQTGQSETIEFTASRTGTFEYYCSVGDHRARGMAGKLIVSE